MVEVRPAFSSLSTQPSAFPYGQSQYTNLSQRYTGGQQQQQANKQTNSQNTQHAQNIADSAIPKKQAPTLAQQRQKQAANAREATIVIIDVQYASRHYR